MTSASPQSTAVPAPLPGAPAVGYCVAAGSVDIQANNKQNSNLEKLAASNDRQDDSGNIYDTIDDVPATARSLPEAGYSVIPEDPDSVYVHPTNSNYDAPTSYQRLSASPSSQPTTPPSAPAAAAAAAAASLSVNSDNVYLQVYDSTNDVPCLYQLQPNATPSDVGYINPLYDGDVSESPSSL